MKNTLLVISLVILLCFTFSCQNKAEKAELEKFRAQAKLEEQNKEIVKREWEAWDKGDLETVKELLAPEYVFYNPSGSTKPGSREEAMKMMQYTADAIFSIEEMLAAGNKVVVRYIERDRGGGQGIRAAGKKVELSGIIIFRLENGKIVEGWEEFDRLGLYQSLGMELKPKVTKK